MTSHQEDKQSNKKNKGKSLEQTLLQGGHTECPETYERRCSVLLAIREMQMKITMRYHPTLVRMAIINKATYNKCWRGCGENGTQEHHWWE